MGECFISRRGGGEGLYKLPVLNSSYPQDVSTVASSNGKATFTISIAEPGKPEEYTYQWYVNGTAVAGAINPTYTRNTTASNVGTFTVYCGVTNKAGTVNSRSATLIVQSAIPTSSTFQFSNSKCKITKESDYNWNATITGSGNLSITEPYVVDIFLQGGGGGGGYGGGEWQAGGGGGAGGKQTTVYGRTLQGNYSITVGSGGGGGTQGGTTTFTGLTSATGGAAGYGQTGGTTGTGAGGDGGGYFGNGQGSGGIAGGQGKRAFNSGSTYYGAGGGGGNGWLGSGNGAGGQTGGGAGGGGNATANTGSGGGGEGGSGGSGIVIIRNAR